MKEKGRGSFILNTNLQRKTGRSSTLIGFLASLLFCAPVFVSCTSAELPDALSVEVRTDVRVVSKLGTKASNGKIEHLDVFVFNDDELSRLDSYERVTSLEGMNFKAASKNGDKILVIIANSDISSSRFVEISSYYDILDFQSRFDMDRPEAPVMSGSCRFTAGEECEVKLTPLMSKVVLNMLDAPSLENIRVYLTHINASVHVMQYEEFKPAEVLSKGDSWSYEPGIELYCYPNNVNEESIGSPFTRLVVEGEKDGEVLYYPVILCEENGIERDVEYHVNLTIKGEGTSSPEDVISPDSVIEKGSLAVFPGNFITGKDGETLHIWVETFPDDTDVQFDIEDLEYDKERGIYDYTIDETGRHLYLKLLKGGTGMFFIHAGEPVNDGTFVVVVCNP